MYPSIVERAKHLSVAFVCGSVSHGGVQVYGYVSGFSRSVCAGPCMCTCVCVCEMYLLFIFLVMFPSLNTIAAPFRVFTVARC